MTNILTIQVIKNGYNPPLGNYSISLPYRSTFKKLNFVEKNGEMGLIHAGMFFPMSSIFLAEDGEKYQVKAIKDTKIAEKLNKDNILTESNGYFIVKEED